MTRERALKVVLAVVGLFFTAGALYGLTRPNIPIFPQMIAGLYGTLGIFLLLATRNPAANRSLIVFAVWVNLVHGAIMAAQSLRNAIPRSALLTDVLPIVVAAILLLVLLPAQGESAAG